MQAARLGASVAVVETKKTFGGPTGLTSKAVREAAKQINQAVTNVRFCAIAFAVVFRVCVVCLLLVVCGFGVLMLLAWCWAEVWRSWSTRCVSRYPQPVGGA